MKRILAFAIVLGMALSLAAWAADAPKKEEAKGTYVGIGKCKMCHMKEYKAWSDTKHAKALENLKAATPEQIKKMNDLLKSAVKDHPEADSVCVRCHVTGYKETGGYPDKDEARNATLAFVGCEVCHGPGSAHMAVPMSDKEGRKKAIVHPTEETCKRCHTADIAPKFDFAEMSKKVHPIAAATPAPAPTPAK